MNRTINPRHLMSAQEVVASTLSGLDVSVVFDASSPWADLTNRVIHLRPVPDQLSEEAVEDIRGDCDHELGHIMHTDPAPLEATKRKLVRKVAEVVEDGRVERLVAAEWLGCGENLERSGRRAVARIAAHRSDEPLNRRARTLCGLSLLSYGWGVEEVIDVLGDDLRPAYEQIKEHIDKLPSLRSTEDVVNLASEIVDSWSWKPVASKAKTPRARENAIARELDGLWLSTAESRKQQISTIAMGETEGSYRAKTEGDKVQSIRPPSFPIGNLCNVFFDGVRKTAPVLRRRLMMKFTSSGERYKRHQKKGELDGRNLWRYGLDDDRIRRRKEPTRSNRSIVSILVDCSASMTRAAREPAFEGERLVFRTRLFIAAQAAAAVSSTLDAIGVPNEVLAFTTSKRYPARDQGYDRVRPLRHLIIKPYNRPFRACRNNFLYLAFFEHCSENIDGEAVLWAGKRILSKPNHGDQPVLIVFSDGDPASKPESRAVLAQHLRRSVNRVQQAGIVVFGIGVGSDAVKSFYDNNIVVNDVSNLLTEFYDLLKKVLQERQTMRV